MGYGDSPLGNGDSPLGNGPGVWRLPIGGGEREREYGDSPLGNGPRRIFSNYPFKIIETAMRGSGGRRGRRPAGRKLGSEGGVCLFLIRPAFPQNVVIVCFFERQSVNDELYQEEGEKNTISSGFFSF